MVFVWLIRCLNTAIPDSAQLNGVLPSSNFLRVFFSGSFFYMLSCLSVYTCTPLLDCKVFELSAIIFHLLAPYILSTLHIEGIQ